MIQEIVSLHLSYTENIMLCHTIIAMWTSNPVDKSSISEQIYNFAMLLSKKYSKNLYEKKLFIFVDELFEKECIAINQKRKNSTLISKNMMIYRDKKEILSDKILICKDCENEFIFTKDEQEFYAERGFKNEPQRCKSCRDIRKNAGKLQKEMHIATCPMCGREAKVPFLPHSETPVYCSNCFMHITKNHNHD